MTKRLLTGVLASFLIIGAIIPTGTFADETIPQEGEQTKKEYRNPFEKTDKTPEEKAELRLEIVKREEKRNKEGRIQNEMKK